MSLLAIFLLSVALSVDAFGTSLSIALCNCRLSRLRLFLYLLTIGVFHFVMPVAGFYIGQVVARFLAAYSNYLVFMVFLVLGVKLLMDSFQKECPCLRLTNLKIFGLGFFLSIDAIFAGVAISLTHSGINIGYVSLIISLTAFLFSFIGYFLGKYLSLLIGKYAAILGGVILIILAVKQLF